MININYSARVKAGAAQKATDPLLHLLKTQWIVFKY